MLRTRLYLGLLPLLLLFIAVGLYSVVISRDLAHSVERELVAHHRAMLSAYEMRDAATRMNNAFYAAQRSDILSARKEYEFQRSRFQRHLFEQSTASSGTPRAKQIEQLDEAYQQMTELAERLLNEGTLSPLAMYQRSEGTYFQLLKSIEDLSAWDYQDLQHLSSRANRTVNITVNLLILAMVTAILFSVYLSYRLARSLLLPIQALMASATALGDGNLERDVPVTSKDELGELARAFNTMAAKLRAYRDAMAARVLRIQRTLHAALTSTPDPVFVVAGDGTHEMRNPAAERLAALPEFAEGLPAPIAEPVRRAIGAGESYMPTGYDRVVTLRVGREDKHFLPRVLAIGDELTGFGGAAIILQDVTKFRLLDDAKNNLVGTVSHELKTPLTGLRLAIYLLLEQNVGRLSPEQRELLETARDDADRLLRILNDLLDLSRLESGASQLNRAAEPVPALLADVAKEIRPILEAEGQRIDVVVTTEVPTVNVDRDRLRHVFINLLANASKYSPPGALITLYAESAEEGYVRFGVRDQGPGIPADNLPFLFERFYRVPGEQKRGVGLGLTIAREIVVAHGGSIACSSRMGEGSDFYFLLPA